MIYLNNTLDQTVHEVFTASYSRWESAASAMNTTSSYFHLLDAVRGAAALVVLCRHTSYFFGWTPPVSHLAVDLFFILSGIVVANAYETRLRAGLPAGRFMLIRLVRLYPFYLLGSLIGLVPVLAARAGLPAQGLQGDLSWTLAAAILMVPALSGDDLFPLDTPAWSLFFELAANFLYALVLRHLGGRLLWTLILLCAAGLVLSLAMTPGHTLHGGFSSATLSVGAFRVGFSFFAGVALYRRFRGARPAGAGGRAVLLVGVLVAVLAASPPAPLRAVYEFVAVTVVFPLLLGVAMRCPLSGQGARWAAVLGTLSYPVYVLHVPVARLLNGVLAKGLHLPVEHWAPYGGIAFLAVFLPACLLADRWYDRPVRARLGSLLAPAYRKVPGPSG
jgi:peptidoglycan/LPS O-acetylase OafA/YrhL